MKRFPFPLPIPFLLPLSQRVLPWAVLLLLCGSMRASQGPGDASREAPLVSVERVTLRSITRRVSASGEVVATTRVRLGLTASGPVRYCPWREGDVIEERGLRLLEIDRPLYRAEVEVARASLAVARATFAELEAGERPEVIDKAEAAVARLVESAAFARRDLARIEELVGNRSLAAEDLEKARVEAVASDARLTEARSHLALLRSGPTKEALQVQQARVLEAEARVALATARLSESELLAPFSGLVTAVHVRPGDLASASMTLLEMVDPRSYSIRFSLPEALSWSIVAGSSIQATFDALPGRSFQGRVVRLYPEVDPRMRTRTCEAEVEGMTSLAPGMFARLVVVAEQRTDVPCIPLRAVRREADGAALVFVLEGDRALSRTVVLGIEEAPMIEVVDGLVAGETVITGGLRGLRDGMTVRSSAK